VEQNDQGAATGDSIADRLTVQDDLRSHHQASRKETTLGVTGGQLKQRRASAAVTCVQRYICGSLVSATRSRPLFNVLAPLLCAAAAQQLGEMFSALEAPPRGRS
jgi:hypothetical protein